MEHSISYKFISVVIPLFNGAQYISRAVISVLSQSYTDFELIVVDDGSTDGGGDVVLEFADPRLRLVRQENAGASAARNKGITEGRGRYIAFLDADDEWDGGFLEAVVRLIDIYPQAGIYGTGYRLVFPKGPVVEMTAEEVVHNETSLLITNYFHRASGGCLINSSGVIIPRSIFDKVGIFKVGVHYGEDLEMWARIALYYPIGYDTRILFSFYQTPFSNKPRLMHPPEHDLKVMMLEEFIFGSCESLVMKKDIMSHIKKYLFKTCISFLIWGDYSATVNYMQNSNALTWTPALARLIRIQFLWPIFSLAAWIYRLSNSRVIIKIFGGQRISHGVVERLSGNAQN